MQNIYYEDTSFVKKNSDQYSLSIRFATDGLSFCIQDSSDKLLVLCFRPLNLVSREEIFARISRIPEEEELLKLSYKKVFLLFSIREKILIPAAHFMKDHLAEFYRLCLPLENGDTLLYREIRSMNAYLAEAMPGHLLQFLHRNYPDAFLSNSAYPFIRHALSDVSMEEDRIFIDMQDRYFDLLIFKHNKVVLFNSFGYQSVTDFLYYLLNCLQNLKMAPDTVRATLSGKLTEDPRFLPAVEKYIPHLTLLECPSLHRILKNKATNSAYFIHLLNIHKCE